MALLTVPCASGSFTSETGSFNPRWLGTYVPLPSGRSHRQGMWCQKLPFSRETLAAMDKEVDFSELQVYHP